VNPSTRTLTPHRSGAVQGDLRIRALKPSDFELTVEDPAEAFEDLRDRNDAKLLAFMSEGFGDAVVSHGVFRRTTAPTAAQGRTKRKATGGKLGPPADRTWRER